MYRPLYLCFIRQPPYHGELLAPRSRHGVTKANQLTAAEAGLLYKVQHTDTCVPDFPRCCMSDVATTPAMRVTRGGCDRGTETGGVNDERRKEGRKERPQGAKE